MQVHLSKQNSIITSQKHNLSSTAKVLSIIIITATIMAMIAIPGYTTCLTGSLLIIATIRYLIVAINQKPLLLEITNEKISYLSEKNQQLITINSADIVSINHKFCELQILTRDEVLHNVNLLNTCSEQTRWEIKEHTKRLTEKIQS